MRVRSPSHCVSQIDILKSPALSLRFSLLKSGDNNEGRRPRRRAEEDLARRGKFNSMASRVIVSKFGGSSCGNAEAYRRLGKYFLDEHSAGHKVVGVFSAMFAVTDRLLNSIQYARDGDKSGVKASREMIWNLHADTARQLLAQPGNAEEALDWMDGHLKK